MKVLVNAVAFQAGWFATVLGAANGLPWLGLAAVLAVGGLHLRASPRPGVEARLLLVAMALGLGFDSLLLATGWIVYPNGLFAPGLAPYWIVALWALFATTLNVSLRWLRGRDVLAVVFGAIGGPLSYLAGARLGAMTFVDTAPALLALAIGWGAMMPLLTRLGARFDGARAGVRPPYIRDHWQKVDSHG
jgi:hypothetical protein